MITQKLISELTETMSLKRLYHTGLFIRLPMNSEGLEPEINLHRAVLDRALLDCFHPNKEIKNDADTWANLENKDFTISCERADLLPELVYETFIHIKRIFKDKINDIPTNFQ